jgi:heme/copper-type cytochrome/quinol oxidase subunit 2
MSQLRFKKFLSASLVLGLLLQCQSIFACAACYAKLDQKSPLAEGMNWGILSLLVVVVCVLSGIAGGAIFLARKSAAASGVNTVPSQTHSN